MNVSYYIFHTKGENTEDFICFDNPQKTESLLRRVRSHERSMYGEDLST